MADLGNITEIEKVHRLISLERVRDDFEIMVYEAEYIIEQLKHVEPSKRDAIWWQTVGQYVAYKDALTHNMLFTDSFRR